MATVENPYEILGEKNVSSARSETEVSFRIDDLVGEAMELVPDRAGVDRSLLADITRAFVRRYCPSCKAWQAACYASAAATLGR